MITAKLTHDTHPAGTTTKGVWRVDASWMPEWPEDVPFPVTVWQWETCGERLDISDWREWVEVEVMLPDESIVQAVYDTDNGQVYTEDGKFLWSALDGELGEVVEQVIRDFTPRNA
jgi:hypothetical protein